MRNLLTALLILTAATSPAAAIVLHPGQPSLGLSLHPRDAVIGRWGTNASCVAIGPDLVITTVHQDEPNVLAPRTVVIDGVSYTATVQADYVGGGVGLGAEIRIAQLTRNGQPADLAYWAGLFTTDHDLSFEGRRLVVEDRIVAIGGYGKGRGASLTTAGGQVYGYQWSGSGNTTLRWGQNRTWLALEDGIGCLFDGPGADPGIVAEAAVAEYDSGGGWFVKEDGRWRLFGLTLGCEHAASEQSWFASATDASPNYPYPDWISALCIDPHAPWTQGIIDTVEPAPGDADRDGDVDYDDLLCLAFAYGASANAPWSMGNFDGDGDVDLVDLGIMAEAYGFGSPVALNFQADLRAVSTVVGGERRIPEPSSLALLLAGGGALRRRRAGGRDTA